MTPIQVPTAEPMLACDATNHYHKGMGKLSPHLSEQLRDEIQSCGKTRYQISKDTGLSQPLLSRFVNDECGLSMYSTDALCAYLNLKLAKRTKADGDTWRLNQQS